LCATSEWRYRYTYQISNVLMKVAVRCYYDF
jgi:hypothetical protein